MKSKDLQNIIFSKYQKGDTPTEIHLHLNDGIILETIKSWYEMTRQSATRNTCYSTDSLRTLKRISKKLKIVCTEDRRYQLESFRGSSGFLRNKCQTNIKD